MSKFRIPRKAKKKWQKSSIFYSCHYHSEHREQNWNWYKNKKLVGIKAMRVIINYPEYATKEEMLAWYLEHYPEDKEAHQLCKGLKP